MKREFIAPELKRIEVNLSNDIADVSLNTGTLVLYLYTWAYEGEAPVTSCIGYIKGGYSIDEPNLGKSISYNDVIAHTDDIFTWSGNMGLGNYLDTCRSPWGNAPTQQFAQPFTVSSEGYLY